MEPAPSSTAPPIPAVLSKGISSAIPNASVTTAANSRPTASNERPGPRRSGRAPTGRRQRRCGRGRRGAGRSGSAFPGGASSATRIRSTGVNGAGRYRRTALGRRAVRSRAGGGRGVNASRAPAADDALAVHGEPGVVVGSRSGCGPARTEHQRLETPRRRRIQWAAMARGRHTTLTGSRRATFLTILPASWPRARGRDGGRFRRRGDECTPMPHRYATDEDPREQQTDRALHGHYPLRPLRRRKARSDFRAPPGRAP